MASLFMAKNPSLNALRGYSYQEYVFMLLTAKMDADRHVANVQAEIKHGVDIDTLLGRNKMWCALMKCPVRADCPDKMEPYDEGCYSFVTGSERAFCYALGCRCMADCPSEATAGDDGCSMIK